jgi:hypothetical protein
LLSWLLPSFRCRCLRDLCAPFRRHSFGPRLTSLQSATAPEFNGSGALALLLWRKLTILDFTRRDIDNEFSELGWVARALFAWCVLCHAFEYGTVESGLLA